MRRSVAPDALDDPEEAGGPEEDEGGLEQAADVADAVAEEDHVAAELHVEVADGGGAQCQDVLAGVVLEGEVEEDADPEVDEEAGEAPKGFVVLRAGHTATPDEIIAFANGKLAGYKKVHYIEIVESIPKNASGKILRRELKELEKARREGK